MRKDMRIAALAALGVLSCACVQENNKETFLSEPNAISLVMSDFTTRSAVAEPVREYSYPLGMDDEGHLFTLKETVSTLDGVGAAVPETRGTPAYTENVVSVHGNTFNGVLYGPSSLVLGDGAFEFAGDGRWRRNFSTDPWEDSDPITFFLRMPASPAGLTNLTYNASAKSIAFDYATPVKAADQQDILFSTRTIDKATYESEFQSKHGASVLFRHALTGVKFAIGNNTTTATERHPDDEVQTFITKVSFKGLKDKGHAVYVQDNRFEQNENDDATNGTHSSKNSFTWTDIAATSRETVFYQTFGDNDIQDFTQGDGVGANASFYAAGEQRNLNKADASLTFWFIPQELTDDVKVEVTFYVWSGEEPSSGSVKEMTMELPLGTLIKAQTSDLNAKWLAGELRTFTLTPTTVDVDITDDMNDEKTEKSNVTIRNTGNKDAYMRVVIVGNWVDTATGRIVAPWSETDGTFTGLGASEKWVKGTDGYWYYTDPVAPGDTPAVPIFTKYTRPSTPPVAGAGLVMDLAVQAIDAGEGTTYTAAWAKTAE